MDWHLRLLDPATDATLFRLAYSWRERPKRHTQPDRMPFEEFAAVRDDQIAVGLFNGTLRALYFLHETEPSAYQAHFTSERGVAREVLLAGAAQVIDDFFSTGATQIHAWVTERNTPLRSFLESLGFTVAELKRFPLQNDSGVSNMSSRNQRTFVKYVLMVNDNRNFRQETNEYSDLH